MSVFIGMKHVLQAEIWTEPKSEPKSEPFQNPFF